MEEKQTVINAAKIVKEFCAQQGSCQHCPFCVRSAQKCLLVGYSITPNEWQLINILEAPQEQPAEPCQDVKGIKPDAVNHPAHYTRGGVECIDAIEAATISLKGAEAVCTGNVIKYVWRWKFKNGAEDLKKAAWYLLRLIRKKDPSWRPE